MDPNNNNNPANPADSPTSTPAPADPGINSVLGTPSPISPTEPPPATTNDTTPGSSISDLSSSPPTFSAEPPPSPEPSPPSPPTDLNSVWGDTSGQSAAIPSSQPSDTGNPAGPTEPPLASPIDQGALDQSSTGSALPTWTPPEESNVSPLGTGTIPPVQEPGPLPMSPDQTTPSFAPAGILSESPPTAPADTSLPGQGEAVPTDLSHLVGNTESNQNVVPPQVPQLQTLVVPPPQDENQVVAGSGSGGFPKWVLIIGALLILALVGGASAYFILGVGQKEAPSTSVPAEERSSLTNPPKAIIPPLTVAPSASPSANFGNLQGVTPTISVAPTSTNSAQSGTSAIELLRRRQGQ